jgi:hypothetical protein
LSDLEDTRSFPPAPEPPAPFEDERVVFAAVLGAAIALALVVIGLSVLGWQGGASRDVAITGLASIGAALAGGFAGWIARGRRRD